jgi:predicted methyltransferase
LLLVKRFMHTSPQPCRRLWGPSLLVVILTLMSCGTPRQAVTPRVHPEDGHDATAKHSFADVERWAAVFDDPRRDAWQKPADVVASLGLHAGMTVADLGAGTGYFIRYLSHAVGELGTVWAVEPEPTLLRHLRGRAESDGLSNVIPVLASSDNPRLPHAGVDRILIVDTYHHIDDRLNYFERVHAMLKPGGRVVIVDWHKRELPEGPPVDHKLAREHVIDEMHMAGYRLVAEPDVLPYQYLLVFESVRR